MNSEPVFLHYDSGLSCFTHTHTHTHTHTPPQGRGPPDFGTIQEPYHMQYIHIRGGFAMTTDAPKRLSALTTLTHN